MLSACATAQGTQPEASSTSLTTSTASAQPTNRAASLADVDDVSAEIRSAVEASRAERWLAWTVTVMSQEPISLVFESGVATGCGSLPSNATHSLVELFDALGSVDQATVQANDMLDPESPEAAMFFYDVQIDDQGRLAATSWYGGHLTMFTTFAYSPEQAPTIDCPSASSTTAG